MSRPKASLEEIGRAHDELADRYVKCEDADEEAELWDSLALLEAAYLSHPDYAQRAVEVSDG